MKTIYKYAIKPEELTQLNLPMGAEILTVQSQKNNVCLWALIDTDMDEPEARTIEIIATGNQIIDSGRKYISTFQLYDGDLVFHAFERL